MSRIETISEERKFVASVGGSVLVKDLSSFDLMKTFSRKLFGEKINLVPFDEVFVPAFLHEIGKLANDEDPYGIMLITGGGSTARMHIAEARATGLYESEDQLDYIGLGVTNTNAAKLLAMAKRNGMPIKWQKKWEENSNGKYAYEPLDLDPGVVTGRGGTYPGHTTDYVAVEAAIKSGASVVVNISNTRGLYPVREDGSLDESKIISEILMSDQIKGAPKEHSAGLHFPFGVMGTRLALKYGITIVLISNDVENLGNLARGEEFVGSILRPR